MHNKQNTNWGIAELLLKSNTLLKCIISRIVISFGLYCIMFGRLGKASKSMQARNFVRNSRRFGSRANGSKKSTKKVDKTARSNPVETSKPVDTAKVVESVTAPSAEINKAAAVISDNTVKASKSKKMGTLSKVILGSVVGLPVGIIAGMKLSPNFFHRCEIDYPSVVKYVRKYIPLGWPEQHISSIETLSVSQEENDEPMNIVIKEDELQKEVRDLIHSVEAELAKAELVGAGSSVDGISLERLLAVICAAHTMVEEEDKKLLNEVCEVAPADFAVKDEKGVEEEWHVNREEEEEEEEIVETVKEEEEVIVITEEKKEEIVATKEDVTDEWHVGPAVELDEECWTISETKEEMNVDEEKEKEENREETFDWGYIMSVLREARALLAVDIPTTISEQQDIPTTIPEQQDIPTTIPEQQDIPTTIPEQQDIPSTIPEQQDIPTTIPEQQDIPTTIPVVCSDKEKITLDKPIKEEVDEKTDVIPVVVVLPSMDPVCIQKQSNTVDEELLLKVNHLQSELQAAKAEESRRVYTLLRDQRDELLEHLDERVKEAEDAARTVAEAEIAKRKQGEIDAVVVKYQTDVDAMKDFYIERLDDFVYNKEMETKGRLLAMEETLNNTWAERMTSELQGLSEDLSTDKQQRLQELAALHTQLQSLMARLREQEAVIGEALHTQEYQKMLLQIQEQVIGGKQIGEQISVLKAKAASDPILLHLIDKIPSSLTNSVPSPIHYFATFNAIRKEARIAAKTPEDGGFAGQVLGRTVATVVGREGVSEDDPLSMLEMVNDYLLRGNLAEAYIVGSKIEGSAGEVIEDWLQSVKERLEFERILEQMKLHVERGEVYRRQI